MKDIVEDKSADSSEPGQSSGLDLLALQMDRIESHTQSCLQNAQNSNDPVNGEISCLKQAMSDWDKALNDNYKFLMNHVEDQEGKTAVKEAEYQWLKSREQQFSAIDLKWKSKEIVFGDIVETPNRRALAEKTEVVKAQAGWIFDFAADLVPPERR